MHHFPDLTPDDRLWRIDWFGEVAYPFRAVRFSQPSIRVALSPLLQDFNYITAITPTATDISAQCEVWMPVGSLPMLRIGDIWQNGQRVAMPDNHLESFVDIEISPATTSFIKAGLSEDGNFLLPHASHPWHMKQTNSYCLCIKLGEGKRVVIPCMEIIRFYFGSSSNLISRLFSGSLNPEFLWRKMFFNKAKGHLHLTLAHKLSGSSAPDLGRIALSHHARRSAAGIHASCLKAKSQNQLAFPYTGFPFEGKTTLVASGIWLPFGQTSDETFVVFNLRSCSFPFPFKSLSYKADDPLVRKKPNQPTTQTPSKSAGQIVTVRSSGIETSTELDPADPGEVRSQRSMTMHELPRFPDLVKKHVWRNKVEAAATSVVFLKRADGSLERISFGEGGQNGNIRPIDIVSTDVASKNVFSKLPKFVRMAIAELEMEPGIKVEPMIPLGFSKLVFPVPMIVDEDGVINESLMFTNTIKGKRKRLACVVKVIGSDGVYSKQAIYEGNHITDPPVVNANADFLRAICSL